MEKVKILLVSIHLKPLILILSFSFFIILESIGQIRYNGQQENSQKISYGTPTSFEIGAIAVTGTKHLDKVALISLSGLKVGDKVKLPGPKIANAITKLWNQKIMEDVAIHASEIKSGKATLIIAVRELPRLSKITFSGISKGQQSALEEEINLIIGRILSASTIKNAEISINRFFRDKGYLNVEVQPKRIFDKGTLNTATLHFNIKKNQKLKVKNIYFTGNQTFHDQKLKRQMASIKEQVRFNPFGSEKRKRRKLNLGNGAMSKRKTKKLFNYFQTNYYLNVLGNSKLKKDLLRDDVKSLLSYYQNQGYKNAEISLDTIQFISSKGANIYININEGSRFYLRDITWQGNFKYSDALLTAILGMKKGDVYSFNEINQRLNYNPTGQDVSALYVDNGHLTFHVNPVEIMVEGDSVDLEMRVSEGPEFVINQIRIKGNERTSDHVIRRELRTLPGQKFSREDVVRSSRELAGSGFFNPETVDVKPIINGEDGTVDLEYIVEEQAGTEFQLSAGLTGDGRFYGTLGASINNFSARKFFKFKDWGGLPIGDGQKLQISAQSNATSFQNYSLSFSEPWFGGKKNNAFSLNVSHVVNERYNIELGEIGKLKLYSASIGLGKQLRWPDDYFQWSNSIAYSYYDFNDYDNRLGITNGGAHSFTFNTTISRYNLDNPLYPRSGSSFALKIGLTPPFSLFSNKDYSDASNAEKFRLIEYHKWDFDASIFKTIAGNLVFHAKASMGFIGAYSDKLGIGPFERYTLGGSGVGTTGDFLIGSQPIGLRGYDENSLVPFDTQTGFTGGVVFNKFTFEMRYPINLGSPLIYVLAFAEAGNTWNNYRDYNPNQLFKSAGVGVRLNLPGMGLIGIDYGYAFDRQIGNLSPAKKNLTFTFGGNQR